MSNCDFLVFGDCVARSDVGKFGLRIAHAGNNPRVIYLQSDKWFPPSFGPVPAAGYAPRLAVCSNIVNNKFLPANHLAAVDAALSIRACGAAAPLLVAIVHDPILAHVAEYLATIHRKYQQQKDTIMPLSALLRRSCTDISAPESFLDQVIPSHHIEYFANLPFESRGSYLLGMLLRFYDVIVCHSTHAKECIIRSLDSVFCAKPIIALPLAYDNPLPPSDSSALKVYRNQILNDEEGKAVTIGLYGMNVDENLCRSSLISFLRHLSFGYSVDVWIAGRDSNATYNALIHSLEDAGDNLSVDNVGFLSDQDLSDRLFATDFVWAYRTQTNGESSGTVLRALSCGACPIVANHGAYVELPNDLVLKLPVDYSSASLLDDINIEDLSCPGVRTQRIAYVSSNHSPSAYVLNLFDSLRSIAGNSAIREGGFSLASNQALRAVGFLRTGHIMASIFKPLAHDYDLVRGMNSKVSELVSFALASGLKAIPYAPDYYSFAALSIQPICTLRDQSVSYSSHSLSRMELFATVLIGQISGGRCLEEIFFANDCLAVSSVADPYLLLDESRSFVLSAFSSCLRIISNCCSGDDEKMSTLLPVVAAMLYGEMLSPLLNSLLLAGSCRKMYPDWAVFMVSCPDQAKNVPELRLLGSSACAFMQDILSRLQNYYCCIGLSLMQLCDS